LRQFQEFSEIQKNLLDRLR